MTADLKGDPAGKLTHTAHAETHSNFARWYGLQGKGLERMILQSLLCPARVAAQAMYSVDAAWHEKAIAMRAAQRLFYP